MFTGIIEGTGKITDIKTEGTNVNIYISVPFLHELKIDQSIAHNGVCLTVVELLDNAYRVTAIEETLKKTNLKNWVIGTEVNVERCMPANGRFDGHIVQGHIDDVATCVNIENRNGSWVFDFKISKAEHKSLLVDKGSVCINGISLTVVEARGELFSVAIIPYTYEFTNIKHLKQGSTVNIEFDIVGKYIAKQLAGRIY